MTALTAPTSDRPSETPALEISGLRFAYPDGTQALRGVDLRIEQGEKVALLGPNGAGKSTLLLQLPGVLRGEGTVRVLGEVLTDRTLKAIRSRVGLLFSNPDDQLFSPTVLEDVAYGPLYMGFPPDEVRARARRALAEVGMEAFESRAPHHLSLGQKKRVAIASVLSMGTPILAFDEPSASLDTASRRELIQFLAGLDRTMLISTHDLALVRDLLPRSVLLDEGQVVADRRTEDLIYDDELLGLHGLEPLERRDAPRELVDGSTRLRTAH